ncbi:emp24/gp25L/p24 family protein [Terasakiella sp. SH-1]|uniref:emp24/gp25L/p24 family protein n=1 Tax=Terasakiella sp. SH-1 TaxID=2560057 RepID=UPI001074542C|nr:emp24/gp25L/p24 family protein [Terasakiella sp. SH-1]
MRILLTFLVTLFASSQAFAAAYVAPVVAFAPISEYVEVTAGNTWWKPIPVGQGDQLRATVYVYNKVYDDVDAYICSETDLRRYNAGQRNRCQGVNRGKRQFQFQYTVRSPERHYFVVNNSFSMMVKKKVNFSLEIAKQLDEQKRQTIEKQLMGFSNQIQKTFDVQEFDIHLKPCGTQNAYTG